MTFQQSCGGEESKPKSKTPLPFYYDDDFSCAITNPVRSSRERNRGRKKIGAIRRGKTAWKEAAQGREVHPGCFILPARAVPRECCSSRMLLGGPNPGVTSRPCDQPDKRFIPNVQCSNKEIFRLALEQRAAGVCDCCFCVSHAHCLQECFHIVF